MRQNQGLWKYNKFLSRLSKICIWMFAFLIVFNNDNFHNSLTQLINGVLSGVGIYATRSAISNYISIIEVFLIAIPLVRFFIYFFQNLDGYIDLFYNRTAKKDTPNVQEEISYNPSKNIHEDPKAIVESGNNETESSTE